MISNNSRKIFMKKIDEIEDNCAIDFFILAAHIDSRSFSAYEKLVEKGVIINKLIILDYKILRPMPHSDQYEKYYRFKDLPNTEYVPCDYDSADCEYINCVDFPDHSRVFIDITSINIPNIFRLIYVFKEIHQINSLDVVYSEPKYYKYFNGFYFDFEREVVERNYCTLPEYFTSAISRDVILICFLGFERLISKYIHERNEHSDVLAINGFPAYYPKIKDISIEHNYELISAIGTDRIHYSQANDPFSTFNTLLSIKKDHDDCLLDICILGSKPMALGACIFALSYPDNVKVSYPFAKDYQAHSSIDVADIWWYRIII